MKFLKVKKRSSSSGFTLIELLIVIIVLAVLSAMLLVTLNVFSQIGKAKDAQRRQDFVQIRNALDTYYNDHNYYPQTVPFGTDWAENGTVYMQKVPQDPDYYTTGYGYVYQTNTNTATPQWAVLYARLSKSALKMTSEERKTNCPLIWGSVCPFQLSKQYTYCVISGAVECDYVKTAVLPGPVLPSRSPTPSPVNSPTESPGVDCSGGTYYVNIPPCNSANPPATWCKIFGAGGAYDCYPDPTCSGVKCSQ